MIQADFSVHLCDYQAGSLRRSLSTSVIIRSEARFLLIALLCAVGALVLSVPGSPPRQISGSSHRSDRRRDCWRRSGFQQRSSSAPRRSPTIAAVSYFRQIPAESGVVKVSAAGFQVRNLLQWHSGHAGAGPLQIVLLPASAAEQVTVTANRTGVRVIENATSVTILSAQDLDATAAFRTDDILRQVPGFSLFRRTTSRTANPTTQGVSLRGLGASGASRALVLSDGFPLNDPFGGWVYWDRVPRVSIGSIEVASGGASHLYGSDALGGVINIIRAPVDRNAISLEAAYGNENSPDLSLAASKKHGTVGHRPDLGAFPHRRLHRRALLICRGAVDTPVNSQDASGDLTVQRKFGDRGGIFARGSLFGESRHNGTPLQTNSTTIRELDLGGNWDGHELGAFAAACLRQPSEPEPVLLVDRRRPQQREPDSHPGAFPPSRSDFPPNGSTRWGRASIWWRGWRNRTLTAKPMSRDTSAAIPPALPRAEGAR